VIKKYFLSVILFFLPIFSIKNLNAQTQPREAGFVERSTFFKNIIGETEENFAKNNELIKKTISWDPDKNVYMLKNNSSKKYFQAGTFSTLSIEDLRKKTATINSKNPGNFNVIEAESPIGQPYYQYVDIGANQADPKNKDVVFQVASNFNALELTSPSDQMENISNYIYDKTQGPFASISAGSGLILRSYYAFITPKELENSNSKASTWKQYPVNHLWTTADKNKQLNLLQNTDIPVLNSYVAFYNKKLSEIKNFETKNIEIGWHENIQVTSGLMQGDKHMLINDPLQIINQVFTAAVDFYSNQAFLEDKKAINIAQNILDAAYEGTLRAAALFGKKKVYLSLIGGGVFQNKLSWIASAIEKMENFIKNSGLEVTLIIFDSTSLANQINDFRTRMEKLAQNTGGDYIRYSPGTYNKKTVVEKKETVKTNASFEILIKTLNNFTNKLSELIKKI